MKPKPVALLLLQDTSTCTVKSVVDETLRLVLAIPAVEQHSMLMVHVCDTTITPLTRSGLCARCSCAVPE
jgi:hypothetical protein